MYGVNRFVLWTRFLKKVQEDLMLVMLIVRKNLYAVKNKVQIPLQPDTEHGLRVNVDKRKSKVKVE
jgi:hypothetical protein